MKAVSRNRADGAPARFVLDNHLDEGWFERQLRSDVAAGLAGDPKSIPPKWFYDEVGSELFDRITRLPEYYPTEREREILVREADEIAELSGADVVVELGSGTSDKTRTLLRAFSDRGELTCFVPFDVSAGVLESAGASLAEEFPGLSVHAVAGDFEHHLEHIPRIGRRLFVFLGGTIGNFAPGPRARFLEALTTEMDAGDSLLLGTDLVKSIDRLELAYDDPGGVTAEFNKNLLAVLNRELGADFDLGAFDHVAFFDPENEWIDLRLRSTRAQTVTVAALSMRVDFAAGEELHTEISAKFREEGVADELSAVGLEVVRQWTDTDGDFLVTLARRPA